jgi:glutathione-regulated potassium-efflux system ancillary protein KefG
MARSRAGKILAEAVRELPGVTFRELYKEYPDFKIDAAREQKFLLENDLIVFQHPFYWYSCPPLFKAWEEIVLTRGFAYPPGSGDRLKGKHWLPVITTGGPAEAYRPGGYNNYTVGELLLPFRQTANLCGMKWIEPFIVHGVLPPGIPGLKTISDEELAAAAASYRALLEGYSL